MSSGGGAWGGCGALILALRPSVLIRKDAQGNKTMIGHNTEYAPCFLRRLTRTLIVLHIAARLVSRSRSSAPMTRTSSRASRRRE